MKPLAPYDLQVIDNSNIKDKNYKLKVKLKLKADKAQGIIAIDEHTHILGVPETAWQYKLGVRRQNCTLSPPNHARGRTICP